MSCVFWAILSIEGGRVHRCVAFFAGTKGDYDPGQVEAFQKLVAKYGEEITFTRDITLKKIVYFEPI